MLGMLPHHDQVKYGQTTHFVGESANPVVISNTRDIVSPCPERVLFPDVPSYDIQELLSHLARGGSFEESDEPRGRPKGLPFEVLCFF